MKEKPKLILPTIDTTSILDEINRQYEEFNQKMVALVEDIPKFEQALIQDRDQFSQWIEAWQETTSIIGKVITQTLDEADFSSSIVAEALVQAGFWIPPSAHSGLLNEIKKLVDDNSASPENTRQVICDFYSVDKSNNLRLMVNDWSNNPYFRDRMPIISDALDAHVRCKYTLSIPALLPLIEGILTSIVGRRAIKADGGIGGWAGNAIEDLHSDYMHGASKDAIITYITGSSVYGNVPPCYFSPDQYQNWLDANGLTGNQVLQRHAILHGVQKDYSSIENSLRAFLILDVLFWMKREEWDRRLKLIFQKIKT